MRIIWWIYFALLVMAGVAGLFFYAALIGLGADFLGPGAAIAAVVDTVAIVGLWGMLTKRRIGWRAIWIACYLVTLLQVLMVGLLSVLLLLGYGSRDAEGDASALFLAGTAFALPLIFALQRYAFGSPEIWAGARGDRAP